MCALLKYYSNAEFLFYSLGKNAVSRNRELRQKRPLDNSATTAVEFQSSYVPRVLTPPWPVEKEAIGTRLVWNVVIER